MFAIQVGLQAPVGGFLVLLIVGVIALVGLVLCIVFGISMLRGGPSRTRDVVLILVGVVMVSPAVWLTAVVFRDLIPRKKSWDLSTGRSAAMLKEENDDLDPETRERVGYTYSGNIHSLIRVDSAREWSGNARSVYFTVKSETISELQWTGPNTDLSRAHEQARSVLSQLKLAPTSQQELEAWYAKARQGERGWFTAEERLGTNAKIYVQVSSITESSPWSVNVRISWDDPER